MSSEVERFLKLIAEDGLGIDTRPAIPFQKGVTGMYEWWAAYVERAEYRLQKHAKMILAEYKKQQDKEKMAVVLEEIANGAAKGYANTAEYVAERIGGEVVYEIVESTTDSQE